MIGSYPATWEPQALLAPLSTLRVGGSAQWLAMPRSVAALQETLRVWQGSGLALTVLGAGSNVLISDRGLPGLVLCTKHLRESVFEEATGKLYVGAGESLPRLASQAADRGWSGLEWAVGIPGTVGGMVVMNAGAQGGCAAECVDRVEVIAQEGEVATLAVADLHYGYRASILQKSQYIVTKAVLHLQPGHDPALVRQKTQENWHHRHSTQPYHLPSCGSVFRNPPTRSAGWLIEQTGLKGVRIGNAQVSELHANFILNLGGATATDVYRLIQLIQEKVAQKWSIQLETEVKMIGEFS